MNTPTLHPILHHYASSPYAEKVRAILGFKNIAWQSVSISQTLPRPHLSALTGGYRKTPVLQIGRDVFCDSSLIARVLEQLAPTPSLYPAQHCASANMMAAWADQQAWFKMAVSLGMQGKGFAHAFAGATPEQIQAFVADRQSMSKNGSLRFPADEASSVLQTYCAQMEQQLADGRAFLLGAASIADFSLYHPLWFIQKICGMPECLQTYPLILQWMRRIAELGHGKFETITSETALEIARAHKIGIVQLNEASDPSEHVAQFMGQAVSVAPTDYGLEETCGILMAVTLNSVTIARTQAWEAPGVGEVRVHFPRIGYAIKKI